jgi:hypothetical protein
MIDLVGTNYFVNVEFKAAISRIDYLLDDGKYYPQIRNEFNQTGDIYSGGAPGDWVRNGAMLGNNKDFLGCGGDPSFIDGVAY